MSQSAMSTPLIALYSTGPLRQYELTKLDCQMSSISSTLRPTRNGFRYCSSAVWTTSARCVKVAQPQPTSPGSVVSTFTTTSRIRFGAVRIVLMSRILTGAVPVTAWAKPAKDPGASAPASDCVAGINDAPPAIERVPNRSRRFMVLPPEKCQLPAPRLQREPEPLNARSVADSGGSL